MNNKGTISVVVTWLLLIALLLIVLAAFFIGPKAILNSIAKGTSGLVDKMLLGMGSKEKIVLESDKSLEEIYDNILSMLRTEGNGPCIFKYKPFSADISNFKLHLSKSDQGIFVQLENNNGQFLKPNTISGKVPCVVGEGEAAQNFYNNYIAATPCKDNCMQDYNVANVILNNGDIYGNGNKRSLNDRNIVFKTKDGNVCFFPTKKFAKLFGCGASEEGLDDACIQIIEKNMKMCGGAEYKEAFVQGTYYGKLDEWKIVSTPSSGRYYYYTGADLRTPYMFRIEAKDDSSLGRSGLTDTELNNIFSSESVKIPIKQGIYFNNVYYDIKEN